MTVKKTKPTLDIELELKNQGYKYIIGVDEAGRGPLAGPVVAAAVHIPEGFDTSGINDSKKLSSKKRELFYNTIMENCDHHVYEVDHNTIDAVNIREATKMAMRWAIMGVSKADYAIVDGNFLPDFLDLPAKCVIGGDAKSISIAAASIVAKVTRDRIMQELHKQMPIYGFDKHKGYGTQFHREMIQLYGPCWVHRKSFKCVKEYVK